MKSIGSLLTSNEASTDGVDRSPGAICKRITDKSLKQWNQQIGARRARAHRAGKIRRESVVLTHERNWMMGHYGLDDPDFEMVYAKLDHGPMTLPHSVAELESVQISNSQAMTWRERHRDIRPRDESKMNGSELRGCVAYRLSDAGIKRFQDAAAFNPQRNLTDRSGVRLGQFGEVEDFQNTAQETEKV